MRLNAALAILLVSGGCYLDRAVWDPYSAAPTSQSVYWTPPVKAQKKRSEPFTALVPVQDAPLSLAELIDVALSNNTQTQLTWAQARSAAAQYAETQNTDLPNVSADLSYQRQRASNLSTVYFSTPAGTTIAGASTAPSGGGLAGTPVVNQYFLTQVIPQLSVTYTILDFGQQRASTEAARFALYFADWSHNRQIQTIINTLTDDYYNYVYEKQLQEAYGEDVKTAEVTFEAAMLGLQMGVQDISDMLQTKTQLLQRQTTYVAEASNVQMAYATLLNDMGLPSQMSMNFLNIPTELPSEALVRGVDDLISIALETRPDLMAASADLESKEQNLQAAKKAYWPTLDFTFDLARTYYGSGLHDQYDFTTLFSFNVPIFSGFSNRNNVKIAEANKEESRAHLRTVQLEITKQISTAHYNVKIAYDTLLFADETLKAAEKEFEVILQKYRVGTSTIIDLLSAQSTLADARASRVSALKGWYTSLATLAYATGVIDIQPEEKT